MGQTQYRSKCWVFKSQFSFKVRQHGKQQFNLQYKVCWILYKKVRALSSSKTFLYLQPPLQPPSKIHSSTSVSFHFPTPHYLFTKSCLQSPLPLPFSINQQFFTSFFFRTAIPATPTRKAFFLPQPWESLREWLYFNLCLLPWNMDRKNWAHNHWFFIAQAQKIGVLKVVVSDEGPSNKNDKPFNPPLSYYHYFHILLSLSQELKFPSKPVAQLDFHPRFNILLYFSYPFTPICL